MTALVALTDPRSAAAEAFHTLRTNLEFSALEQELRAILVVAAGSSKEGARDDEASAAVANLGVVMAQAGEQVLIVDGDLRRPRQHELFGLPNARGLATWLAEGGPATDAAPLQKSTVENLSLLTAGPAPANPVALLSTRRLDDALAALRAQADRILIAAPPVLGVTDAALWAAKVDGVVLLLHAGRTKRDEAQRAKAVLEKVHARLLGAVLLNADRTAAPAGYGAL